MNASASASTNTSATMNATVVVAAAACDATVCTDCRMFSAMFSVIVFMFFCMMVAAAIISLYRFGQHAAIGIYGDGDNGDDSAASASPRSSRSDRQVYDYIPAIETTAVAL